MDRIVSEARELLADGAFELNIIGQDTTSYGDDIGAGLNPDGTGGLPALLRALSDAVTETSGSGWLRLMYAYPTTFTRPIIDAFGELTRKGRLLPYLDIPLQHGSDAVLKAMRRHVTRRQQEDLIRSLRGAVPGIAIRTTFISGFPGETEADHRELLEFVREMAFENVGVFEYSREPGTVAGTMEQDAKLAVNAQDKARRRAEIMELQQGIVFARNAAMAETPGGAKVDVLIDAALRTTGRKTSGVSAGGKLYQGRTSAQAPQIDGVTFVHSRQALSPGELIRCVVVESEGYDLVARPVDDLERKVSLHVRRDRA